MGRKNPIESRKLLVKHWNSGRKISLTKCLQNVVPFSPGFSCLTTSGVSCGVSCRHRFYQGARRPDSIQFGANSRVPISHFKNVKIIQKLQKNVDKPILFTSPSARPGRSGFTADLSPNWVANFKMWLFRFGPNQNSSANKNWKKVDKVRSSGRNNILWPDLLVDIFLGFLAIWGVIDGFKLIYELTIFWRSKTENMWKRSKMQILYEILQI